MSESKTGQVVASAAEVYEDFFIPALFEEWPPRVADAAHIGPGQRVLDVACGTGVLARYVAGQVGPDGSVIGVDINDGMLAVARRIAPEIEWRHGEAEQLPFAGNTFDAVVSQFALMFFRDRQAAIKEMVRVLRPGGHLAVAVWDFIENSPGYAAMAKLLRRLFGEQAADALRFPYVLGDIEVVQSLFANSELPDVEFATYEGTARFPSIESWVYTDIRGWTLADMIDAEQYETLLREARRELRPFANEEGKVAFSSPAHIISATKV